MSTERFVEKPIADVHTRRPRPGGAFLTSLSAVLQNRVAGLADRRAVSPVNRSVSRGVHLLITYTMSTRVGRLEVRSALQAIDIMEDLRRAGAEDISVTSSDGRVIRAEDLDEVVTPTKRS